MDLNKLKNFTNLDSLKESVTGLATEAASELVQQQLQQAMQRAAVQLNSSIAEAGLDPLPLPSAEMPFTTQLCGCVPASGTAQLAGGEIKGFATVQEVTESSIEGQKVTATVQLQLGPLAGSSDAQVSLSCFSLQPVFTVSCERVGLLLQLEADVKSRKLSLKQFSVEEVAQVVAKAQNVGNPFLRSRLAPVLLSLAESQQQRIKTIVEGEVKGLVTRIVDDVSKLRQG